MSLGQTPNVGFYLGSITGGMRDGALRWTDIAALARRAEAVGFDSFWVPDHLLFRFEGQPAHAPWVRDGRSFRHWPPRPPASGWVARDVHGFRQIRDCWRKMADTVDEISGGRFHAGRGRGLARTEYLAYGYPPDAGSPLRGSRFSIIRTFVRRDGHIDHRGTVLRIAGLRAAPAWSPAAGSTIMIGALASRPRMLRLAATYADIGMAGWSPGRSYADQGAVLQAAMDAACAKAGSRSEYAGTDGSALWSTSVRQIVSLTAISQPVDRSRCPQETLDPGTPEEIATELGRLRSRFPAGTGVSRNRWSCGGGSVRTGSGVSADWVTMRSRTRMAHREATLDWFVGPRGHQHGTGPYANRRPSCALRQGIANPMLRFPGFRPIDRADYQERAGGSSTSPVRARGGATMPGSMIGSWRRRCHAMVRPM